jgi:S-adenosylmethionine-diacylgycerolhomoserine-N-methlytransferase
MNLLHDLKTLYHLTCPPVRGANHGERMESFYTGQAQGYDQFRQRLLPGRELLYRSIDVPDGGVWVDLGGGTGANFEYLADRLPRLQQAVIVDLAPSLLEVARSRCERRSWRNVQTCRADATTYRFARSVDVVTFAYSLTMMPDWFAAIDNALSMLKPGGQFGVVDFYVSRKHSADDAVQHGWWTRHGWPLWFAHDNVFLSGDHLPYLRSKLAVEIIQERRTRLPYLPLVRAPYYVLVGRRV